MIEKYLFFHDTFAIEESKEVKLFSIIAQSFFQPFSLIDNLLVILTALTAGSGVGFNRALLFLREGDRLRGQIWLGPRSPEEASSIWEVLSIPGVGYAEIIEHNRALLTKDPDSLTTRSKNLTYLLNRDDVKIPALAASKGEIFLVRDAWNEPLVDRGFLESIKVDEFLCVPLLAQNEILGEIVLDNAITHNLIQAKAVQLASICGVIASNNIYISQLQNKMVDMEKLAAAGEMAMFITHQLRNPLVTIGGFADQLLDNGLDDKKRKRNVQIIRNEIQRLEKVLFRLSQFLKIEKKQMVLADIQEILNVAVSSSRTKIKAKNISLNIELEQKLPKILCEPIYTSEAVRNVLDNALDAVSAQGKVDIMVYCKENKWLCVSITDNGPGIPESIKSKIFQAFFSTKETGMGLGLSYVKRVMETFGGRIEVESQEGKGTTFHLYFKTEERG